PAPLASPIRYVIIVSVDGLLPETYTDPDAHGLKVPTLRELAKNGAASPGALSVIPASTYIAHTTIATGTYPRTHGIVTNQAWDPLGKNQEGWRWYTEDIKVPTLWDAARKKGLRTALIDWPVTVGAKADAVVPEYWRASTPEDMKMTRAISKPPGIFEAVVKRMPDFWKEFTPPDITDKSATEIALHLIETQKPQLVMLHIYEVDHWQHKKKPWSPEAIAAIENADAQIARVIASARKAGTWEQTALVLVSDHGFRTYSQQMRPGVLLRDKKLITLDDRNRVTDWKAVTLVTTGTTYLYVKNPKDDETKKTLREIFEPLAGKPGTGVGRLFTHEQIVAIGGDPQAYLCIEAADNFRFTWGYAGELIAPITGDPAGHGFAPDHPDMKASLIFYGPAIAAGKLDGARLMDVAPTVAGWLGFKMERAEGRTLPVVVKRKQAAR
ncbi:MAG TPA: ectonucleotide pyrophosphatase/phosphodiesterase, partial [Candidatus Acidoferrales bacterium]|nr:ectonucleotide pyrophosphatase/phosphodiesterase [Candidatus Acidoferrales bacterium]